MGLKDRFKGFKLDTSESVAIDPEMESAIRALRIPLVDPSVSADLTLTRTLGQGGNSTVMLGNYRGQQRAIKITTLSDIVAVHKILKWMRVIQQLRNIPNILIPIDVRVQRKSGLASGSYELYEIYPVCLKYKSPDDIVQTLHDMKKLAIALIRMHQLHIVHLDFKYENILLMNWENEGAEPIPVISDFGEARFFRNSSDTADAVSTTISLILENPYVRSMCQDLTLLDSHPMNAGGLYYRFIHNTPEKFLPVIDALLFGIYVVQVGESLDKPFLTRSFPRRGRYTLIGMGKAIIASCMLTFGKHWNIDKSLQTFPLTADETQILYAADPLIMFATIVASRAI